MSEAAEQIEVEEEAFELPVEDETKAEVIPLEDPTQQKRVIEALIFASPEAVSLRSIHARLPQTADVGRMLLELQDEYKDRGVNLVQMEDVWAFRTATDIGPHLSLTKKEEKKLSRAALETMAIIAYHQPVTRAEVENIRGVATNKGTLDVLMESGWIKPGRRRETPGRPVTWTTTNQFLDDFGISNLNDLPGLNELKASGLLDTRPAIDTIGADLFNSANENISEAEKDAPLGEFDQETDEIEEEENEMTISQTDVAPEDENEEILAMASADDEDSEEAGEDESDEEESDEEDEDDEDDDDSDEDDDEEDDD